MMYPLIEHATEYEAVILANGDFPTAEAALRLLHASPYVCACDGAAIHYPSADVIVGDGDSVPKSLEYRLICIDEQEDNDLTKATRHCLSKGMRRIVYLGATGQREDHTLGNISLMVRYFREMGVQPLMATDHGWFVLAEGRADFEAFPRQQVSLFNISCHQLTSVGLKWEAYPYTQQWQGTLNEAIGNTFTIEADGCYMVYRTYQPK